MLPFIGYLLLTAAYLGISLALFAGQSVGMPVLVLLGLSGLGLGTEFATLVGHLTNVVPDRYAPDISGVTPPPSRSAAPSEWPDSAPAT